MSGEEMIRDKQIQILDGMLFHNNLQYALDNDLTNGKMYSCSSQAVDQPGRQYLI